MYQDIITKGGNTRKFILKESDEKFVIDMLTNYRIQTFKIECFKNLKITQKKGEIVMSNKTKDILDEILDVEESTIELVEKK